MRPFDPYAIEVASYVSDIIKRSLIDNGEHQHVAAPDKQSFPTISVKPIKLSKTLSKLDPDTLETDLKDDIFLRGLAAKIRENENSFYTPSDSVPAVLLLRRHFGRSYPKALAFREHVRARKLRVPIIPRISFIGNNGWTLHFKLYGYMHAATVYMIWLASVAILNSYLATPSDASFAKFFLAKYRSFEELLWLVMPGLLPLSAVGWALVVNEKRRKTLQAYDRAIGIMKSGNYFHAVLARVMSCGRPHPDLKQPTPPDFEMLITKMEEMKRIETEKARNNTRVFFWVGMLGLIAGLSVFGVFSEIGTYLKTERIREIIEILSLGQGDGPNPKLIPGPR